MAFLKNLQEISSAVTSTLVTSANATNRIVGAVDKGASAVDNLMAAADVLADKTLQTTTIRADGELRKELEALWKEFPDLRPKDQPEAKPEAKPKAKAA